MDGPLAGKVALVAGATRGAGRGIALELAAAGAKVYCSGRSTKGRPASGNRPETIEETAEMIVDAGGEALAVRVDHSSESEVAALAARVRSESGRLDLLVNDIWGGDGQIDWSAKFWTLDMNMVRSLVDQAVFTHLITARHLTPLMLEGGRGLIVEITDGELPGYRGQFLHDLVKSSVNRLAYGMAWDLAATRLAAVAISPGFLRSEAMLEKFGVTEATWRDAVADHPDFEYSETPRFVGRAVAALAADPRVRRKSGLSLFVGDLADEYGFNDVDGSRPHFMRSLEAWLDGALAGDGELSKRAQELGSIRYQHIHNSPRHAARARRYAARLGFERLGAGLLPIEG